MKNLLGVLSFVALMVGSILLYAAVPLGIGYFIYSLVKYDVSFLTTVGYSILVSVINLVLGFVCTFFGLVCADQNQKIK